MVSKKMGIRWERGAGVEAPKPGLIGVSLISWGKID
jgi:hypothetical protein